MFKRIGILCFSVCLCGELSADVLEELPNGCATKENAFVNNGYKSKMGGELWTDVIQTNDGRLLMVSTRRSQVAILENSGQMAAEFKLPDSKLTPMQIAVQPGGRILIAGIHKTPAANGLMYYEVQVLGMNQDGSLDENFGDKGVFRFPSISGYVNLALRCDGQIYLAFDHGYSVRRRLKYEFVVVRLNADGKLDRTFGAGGTSAIRIGSVWNSPESLMIREDGALLVGGQTHIDNVWDATLFQLTADGKLDPNFGEMGRTKLRSFSGNNSAKSIEPLTDNAFVSVGFDSGSNWISLAKHLPNGTLDSQFGVNGFAYAETPSIEGEPQFFTANAVRHLENGSFLIGGRLNNAASDHFLYLVTRLNSDGKLDQTFGTNGFVSVPLPGKNSGGEFLLEPSGSFVIVADGRQPEAAMIHRFDLNGKFGN